MLGVDLGSLLLVGHALVGREDLPIPFAAFVIGAGTALVLSFIGLVLAWPKPRFEHDRWRPLPSGLSTALLNPFVQALCGLAGVFLLGLVVWSGLRGTEAPDRNFSVTFAFVTVLLGMVVVSVVAGDVFRAFNPWRAIARAVGGVFKLVAGQSAPPPLVYPERLGRWPAAIGLVAVGWFELAYGASGFQAVGLTPHSVGVATVVYTVYTLIAMTLFGSERWLERGETFSVYFGMFASLSAFETREGRIGVRRMLAGAPRWVAGIPGSIALVLFTIAITTFDGAQEGLLKTPLADLKTWLADSGLGPAAVERLGNSVFLLACLVVVPALFWAGIYGMQVVQSRQSLHRLGALFAHAFIPIALAYLFAHYFSLVVFQEQAQFGFLLSDPLGDGSDLFGTAGSGIDYTSLSANAIWYAQVAGLVVGHVIALTLGHDRALEVFEDRRDAARSQYAMLALMVMFTWLGLYLLSEANG
jgi:hypothetical protein